MPWSSIQRLFPQRRSWARRLGIVLVAVFWAAALAKGIMLISSYESTPGAQGEAPAVWPRDSCIQAAPGRFNLVLFIHSRCPCTSATVSELARIMPHVEGKLCVHAVFVNPQGESQDWSRTALFESTSIIPNVTNQIDQGGLEAKRFGAATSGQTVLYDPRGRLLFSGGITESRGHEGDNAGASAIIALVNSRTTAAAVRTPVFGCALCDTLDNIPGKAPVCSK
jgi:hypothetical protein